MQWLSGATTAARARALGPRGGRRPVRRPPGFFHGSGQSVGLQKQIVDFIVPDKGREKLAAWSESAKLYQVGCMIAARPADPMVSGENSG